MNAFRTISRAQDPSKNIDKTRAYSYAEASVVLHMAIGSIYRLCNRRGEKPAKISTVEAQDGSKVIPGEVLLDYVVHHLGNSRPAKLEQVRISHKTSPGLEQWKSVIASIDTTITYTQKEVEKLFGFKKGFVYKLITSRDGKPARYASVDVDGTRLVPGSEVLLIAKRMAEVPKDRASMDELMSVLLIDNEPDLYKKFYREDGKVWFRHTCVKSKTQIFYPVYYDIYGTPCIDRTHLAEIQQDISSESYVHISKVCKLTGRTRKGILTDIDRTDGVPGVLVPTFFRVIKIPVIYPFPGQAYFGFVEHYDAERTKEHEAKNYVSLPDLAKTIDVNGKPLERATLAEFVRHHKDPADSNFCVFTVSGEEKRVHVFSTTNFGGSLIFFKREEAKWISKFYEEFYSRTDKVSLIGALKDYTDRHGAQVLDPLLARVEGKNGTRFLSVNDLDTITAYQLLGRTYVRKSDLPLIRLYFQMCFLDQAPKPWALHRFEADFRGLTLAQVNQNSELKRRFRLWGAIISGASPATVAQVSRLSRVFRSVGAEDFFVDGFKLINSEVYITEYEIPIEHKTFGDYFVFPISDGRAFALYAQAISSDSQVHSTFFENYLLFEDFIKNHGIAGRQSALFFLIYRAYASHLGSGVYASQMESRFNTKYRGKYSVETLTKKALKLLGMHDSQASSEVA